MAVSASFLATALATIQSTPEYATFTAALARLSAAAEDDRQARWNDAYSDGQVGLSPAYRLRRAIRDAITNTAVSSGVTLSPADAEGAYQTLVAQVAPEGQPPAPATVRTPALTAEDLDLIRLAAARLASD